MNKTIGILGGMGPQASCELYRLINEKSSSQKNADFPHLLINSLPVRDLIANADEKERTIRLVADGALALEQAGATDILMACNTMHAFQEEITKGLTHTRFHSLIEIVASKAKSAKKVLFLGSHTTIQTQLYQRALKARHIHYDVPDDVLLSHSVEMILNTIGKNLTKEKIEDYVNHVLQVAKHDPEIDTIVLGCTELPLFFPQKLAGYQVISSLHMAADKIVSLAGKEEK
jgi:aspartate racemase